MLVHKKRLAMNQSSSDGFNGINCYITMHIMVYIVVYNRNPSKKGLSVGLDEP